MSGFFRGYYRYTAFLNRLLPTTKVDGRVIRVLPSVCKPLGNEQVLAEYVPAGKNVLEIGCGSGIITLFLADKSTHVTAVDVSADAVDNTRINLAANAIENVTVILGNAFDKVGGSFDVVASNPPWVDFELDDPLRMWASSSTLIPSLFRESGRFLVHNGLLVISCPQHARQGERLRVAGDPPQGEAQDHRRATDDRGLPPGGLSSPRLRIREGGPLRDVVVPGSDRVDG
jgi:release factor glutamine methyltransferase